MFFNSLSWNQLDRQDVRDFQKKNFNEINGQIEIQKTLLAIRRRSNKENLVISLKRGVLLVINFFVLLASLGSITYV